MKNLLILFVALFILTSCNVNQKVSLQSYDDILYSNIEFEMPRVQLPSIPLNSVKLSDFGAISGGRELCTEAFNKAIDALSKKGGGKLIITPGIWLTGPITLKSNIELHAQKGALVVFSTNKDLYPVIETSFEGLNTFRCISPINGRNLENIAITGHGIFDGSGDAWRFVKKAKLNDAQWKKLVSSGGVVSKDGKEWYPSEQFIKGAEMAEMNVVTSIKTKVEFEQIRDFLRPVMVSLVSCRKVLIDGPTFQNSPAWNIHPLMCEDFTMRNTTVRNPWYSQNGDGIDIESCKNSIIHDCSFDVGDDAICVKSGKDKDGRDRGISSENLIVKNCIVYHGHGGVTVGSEMSGGVKNLHVSNCIFIGTDVGLRFKSNRGRGGVVENIFISDIEMMDIPTQAISFNLFYSGRSVSEDLEADDLNYSEKLIPVTEETPQFKNISIRNVNCKGALQGILLQGLPEMLLENVKLGNIKMETDIGLTCSDANGISIENLELIVKKSPVIDLVNTKNIVVNGLKTNFFENQHIKISGKTTDKVLIINSGITNKTEQVILGKGVPENAVEIR